MSLKIRKAMLKDCKACFDLSKSRELLTPQGTPVPLEAFKTIVKAGQILLVAEADKRIEGFAFGEKTTSICILWLLAVKKESRSKGIGTKLLKAFEADGKKRKAFAVVLYAPTFNKKTLKFYRNNGYTKGKNFTEFGKRIK